MDKIKVVVINEETAEVKELDNNIEAFYEVLDCDLFDIVNRRLGTNRSHKRFDIYCDDEGTFKENPRISAIDNLGRVMLVGNLMIAGHDYEGNTISLTDKECKFILDKVEMLSTRLRPNPYPILTQCEW